ncbi:SurA N-terminal domain-containing protein [Glycocaulis abyssi]|uniref:SurA N-terminal domain-containing protein n=1 Tax=Glycocaulis abyssi TaxID=1433403 RepID=A0ABV9N7E1_9PROT
MLSSIRNLARSPIAVLVIIVPVVAAFALFGINDIFTGTGNAVATVGSERVTLQDVSRTMQREMRRIQMENPRMTQQEADEAGLGDNVMNLLVAQAAINAQARELGIAATDEQVFELIHGAPAFQSVFSNRFDPAAYQEWLRQEGWTANAFEAQLRGDLRRQQFIDAALAGATPPAIFGEMRARYQGETRTIRALLIPPALAGEVGTPDDETLEAFIAENAAFFTLPEQRRITLVRLDPQLVAPDVAVDEDELRELYEMRLETGELADAPLRTFLQWVTPDQQTAENIVERLGAGESPSSIAAATGLGDPVRLEDVEQFAVPDQVIGRAAFEMTQGEARAVQGRLGWRAVYVEAATDPEIPAFEAVADELRTELAGDAADYRVLDALAEFEDQRGRGATLEEAAEGAGIPLERFDYMTPDAFEISSGAPLMSIIREETILEAARTTQEGFESDLTPFGDGGYFILRVDAVRASELAPLADVREQAEAFWRLRQIDDRLQDTVTEALSRAEAGESLDAIAASIPGTRVEETTLTRGQTAGPFTQTLVNAAFRARPDTPFEARAGDQRTRTVAIVTAITPGSAELDSDARQAVIEGYESDIVIALERALLDSYDVRINTQLRDAALGRTDID